MAVGAVIVVVAVAVAIVVVVVVVASTVAEFSLNIQFSIA